MKRITIGSSCIEIQEKDLPGLMTSEDAFETCRNLGNSWGLPTISELNEMFENRDATDGYANVSYWSSTKDEFGDSYYMEFFDDYCRSQINTDGDAECYVRAVRSLG
jgi:hypothetical protein